MVQSASLVSTDFFIHYSTILFLYLMISLWLWPSLRCYFISFLNAVGGIHLGPCLSVTQPHTIYHSFPNLWKLLLMFNYV